VKGLNSELMARSGFRIRLGPLPAAFWPQSPDLTDPWSRVAQLIFQRLVALLAGSRYERRIQLFVEA
jgi:hypothetical protein